jgi:hypothetical protein
MHKWWMSQLTTIIIIHFRFKKKIKTVIAGCLCFDLMNLTLKIHYWILNSHIPMERMGNPTELAQQDYKTWTRKYFIIKCWVNPMLGFGNYDVPHRKNRQKMNREMESINQTVECCEHLQNHFETHPNPPPGPNRDTENNLYSPSCFQFDWNSFVWLLLYFCAVENEKMGNV